MVQDTSNLSQDTAIVIVTHDRPDSLHNLISDLHGSLLPESVRELIVIENGNHKCSSSAICSSVRLPLSVSYFIQSDPSKSKALNFAVALTRCQLIIFFDDDIRLEPNTIREYISAAERYGAGHFFGGSILADVAETPPAWLLDFLPSSARGFDLGEYEIHVDRPILVGSNWAARKTDILAADGFPEYLGPGKGYTSVGEESILQRRLLKLGLSAVYLPSARVRHRVEKGENNLQFALDRRFQFGLATMLAEQVEQGLRTSLFPPVWIVRRTIELNIKMFFKLVSGSNLHDRADIEFRLAEARGALAAMSLLRRIPLASEHRPAFRSLAPINQPNEH